MAFRGVVLISVIFSLLLVIRGINGSFQNVALGKATSQATPWKYSHTLAVDGNTNRHLLNARSCTETLDVINPWWEVDLGAEFIIDHVIVHNRGDCCAARLTDVLFEVSSDHVTYEFFYYVSGQVSQIQTIYPSTTKLGRWFKVSMSRTVRLTLCEVEVMSNKRIVQRNLFSTSTSVRGTGEVMQTHLVRSKIECTTLCYTARNCYGVNVIEKAAVVPYLECEMTNSLSDGNVQDFNSTRIEIKTASLD